jgi:hypothetical protein
VLSLERVNRNNPKAPIDDEDDDCIFYLGTGDKTRYEPFHTYLEFDPENEENIFKLAPDPDEENMKLIQELMLDLEPMAKTKLFEKITDKLKLSINKTRNLLNKGEKKYWDLVDGKTNNIKIYKAKSVLQFSSTIYSEKTEKPNSIIQKTEKLCNSIITNNTKDAIIVDEVIE